ncbi:MAG: hypothetical protein KGO02_15515 [Alphaproteobacteria bacterium]|nr:hypothetical protein [Alphaproteobacteria bacterium]
MTDPRLETVASLAEKLITIFEADIDALRACRPQAMASLTPQNQELIAAYGREAQALPRTALQAAPEALRQRLEASTARFREVLNQHRRMVLCVKNASEGLIKAVADEVDRRRARARPYTAAGSAAPNKGATRAQAPGASLLYNAVI